MAADVTRRTTCRLCGSESLEAAFSLQPSAIADAFVPRDQAQRPQARYPLDLALCRACGHVQLRDTVHPDLLFGDYTFRTGDSGGLVEHFRNLAPALVRNYGVGKDALAVEIGSNDGTLLRFLEAEGLRVVGVDPARRIAEQATASGVRTRVAYFDPDVAWDILREEGPAHLVVANNVFAHADDMAGIAEGVRVLLEPSGVFVFEVSYLPDILDRLLFDTIYHEHLCYHAVRPLQAFLSRHGLELIGVERLGAKGGSIRGIAQRQEGPRRVDKTVTDLAAQEQARRIDTLAPYRTFAQEVERRKEDLLAHVRDLRAQGRRVAGFGASATVTTLLHHFELASFLEFLVDDNPRKHGFLSPGHHLEVRSPAALEAEGIDDVIILAWQYAEPIMQRHAVFRGRGGRFIVPLPMLKVI